MDLKNWKLWATAGVAALLAVNGVFHVVSDDVVSRVMGAGGLLGLGWLFPSPLRTSAK